MSSGCCAGLGVGAPGQRWSPGRNRQDGVAWAGSPGLGGAELEWSDRAACLSAEPEQFFPVGGAAAATWEAAMAKRVCAGCEVVVECRDYALATSQPFGVWGGLDEEERRAMLSGRVASAAR